MLSKRPVTYLYIYIFLIPLISFINSSESNNDAKIVTQRIYFITQISIKLNQIIIINNLIKTENVFFFDSVFMLLFINSYFISIYRCIITTKSLEIKNIKIASTMINNHISVRNNNEEPLYMAMDSLL